MKKSELTAAVIKFDPTRFVFDDSHEHIFDMGVYLGGYFIYGINLDMSYREKVMTVLSQGA